jgi:hypothetical protein
VAVAAHPIAGTLSGAYRPDPLLDAEWVDAGPFRAHLRYLMAVGGMTAPEVALLAGVPPTFADHLLYGRRGRGMRRISPQQARRLLRITAADVGFAAHRPVPAVLARPPARRLKAAGWTVEDLGRLLNLPAGDAARLLDGRMHTCSQRVSLRAAAAAAALGPGSTGEHGWPALAAA